jgi:hypothetical protein
MTAVQITVVFVRVEALPLDKVIADFTFFLYIGLCCSTRGSKVHTSFCPAIWSVSQCLVNTTDGSMIVISLSVPWIHKFGTVQAESKL